jgi:hypothetical protein
MQWTKTAADEWCCKVPPEACFTLKATLMGDRRWTWEVYTGGNVNPTATGIVSTLGAAKNACEGFIKRG